MKPRFLLHACCAICSGHVIDQLNQDFEVVAYFFNPNIYPKEEFNKRKDVLEKFCKKNDIEFISGLYCDKEWLKKVEGLEDELEGGSRCSACYAFRLEKVAKLAKESKCDYFGTTLTISPHKKANIINPIGRNIGNKISVKFYEADWKKCDGFKRANEISKKENFYRQSYCGCVYSLR